jgi:hypothetical protein
LVFVTEGARQYYIDRYPEADVSKFEVIPNGFDESKFFEVEQRIADRSKVSAPNPLCQSSCHPFYF